MQMQEKQGWSSRTPDFLPMSIQFPLKITPAELIDILLYRSIFFYRLDDCTVHVDDACLNIFSEKCMTKSILSFGAF